MLLFKSTICRKIVMAVTGQILTVFILFHVSGNSTIFFHKLNAYVAALHTLPVFVWGGRLVLVASFTVHILYGIILKIENVRAKPLPYAVRNYREATFSGRNQIWTGVVIAVFLAYHLLQFTFKVTNPAISADNHADALGRPDVLMMVVRSFQMIGVSGVYLMSLAALGMHLLHGIKSSFQTWGAANDKTLPLLEKTGAFASIILFLWYAAIPLSIVAGFLK